MPTKMWYAPDEKLLVRIELRPQVLLVMSDFQGGGSGPMFRRVSSAGATVDVRETFQRCAWEHTCSTQSPRAKFQPNEPTQNFVGTPLVIGLRGDDRPGASSGAIVVQSSR
jgi:hypothetical protein